MSIRIGVIGTADIAKRRMIPAIKQCGLFEYAGVAIASSAEWEEPHTDAEYESVLEGKKAKAKAFCNEFGGSSYIGYEALLNDSSIDAVYIPLPPALHSKWGKLALQRGKHVLMEKPFCVSLEQAKELLALAEEKNLAVIENYGFIYHAQFDKIKEICKSGEIGKLREIKANFGFPQRESSDFRYSKKYGGGALLDCGGYTLKAALEFMDQPELCFASLVTPKDCEVDIYGSAVLKQNDLCAHLSFGMDNAYKCDFELWGSKGSAISNRAFTAPDNYKSSIKLSTKEGLKEIPCGADNQFLKILQQFALAIESPEKRKGLYKSIERQQSAIQKTFDFV